jgi:ribosomal-protein-alanine N-acetyltransferase
MTVSIRLVAEEDAEELAELMASNRKFFAPWDAVRPDAFYTAAGQLEAIGAALRSYESGQMMPHVIVQDGRIVGRMNLNTIVRGAFQSGTLGYYVAEEYNGRGIAGRATGLMVAVGFEELNLHRIEANTLLHNVASQRVLLRNGFERFGTAPKYLRIAGEWQDHDQFHKINENWLPGA